MTVKQQIKEYVDDHYTHFGFYPYEVEVDGQIYSYGGYWAILEDDRFDQWTVELLSHIDFTKRLPIVYNRYISNLIPFPT